MQQFFSMYMPHFIGAFVISVVLIFLNFALLAGGMFSDKGDPFQKMKGGMIRHILCMLAIFLTFVGMITAIVCRVIERYG